MPTLEDLVGNNKHAVDLQAQGWWGEKTSSVNFCELDYTQSHYIGEFHNTWTSLIFVYMAIIGLLYNNPLKEWRYTVNYVMMMIIGLGSTALHGTLLSFSQSMDEVPMLWMCIGILYLLVENKSPRGIDKTRWWLVALCAAGLVLQTVIYYKVQQLYYIFVSSYLCLVLVILIWMSRLTWYDNDSVTPVRKWIWKRSVGLYFCVGSIVWILDMQLCNVLLPYYSYLGGITFHVIWHFAACYSTNFTVLLTMAVRVQNMGLDPRIEWKWGCPILVVDGLDADTDILSTEEYKEYIKRKQGDNNHKYRNNNNIISSTSSSSSNSNNDNKSDVVGVSERRSPRLRRVKALEDR